MALAFNLPAGVLGIYDIYSYATLSRFPLSLQLSGVSNVKIRSFFTEPVHKGSEMDACIIRDINHILRWSINRCIPFQDSWHPISCSTRASQNPPQVCIRIHPVNDKMRLLLFHRFPHRPLCFGLAGCIYRKSPVSIVWRRSLRIADSFIVLGVPVNFKFLSRFGDRCCGA